VTLADRHPLVVGLDAEESGEVVVAHLQPGVHLPASEEIVDAVVELATGARATVLDLSDVILTESAGVAALVDAMVDAAGEPAACCVVARRASARRLLRQWAVDRKVCLFGSIGDALQARVHSLDGYGLGWSLTPPSDRPS
jgi:anti-anti-sigma regulatory factor